MILALALAPSVDVTLEVDRLRIGGISRPHRVTRVAGGKSLNVARTVRALGSDARVVAALGGSTGRWIADELARVEVESEIVEIAGETRSCLAIVEDSGGTSSTDLYEPPTAILSAEWELVVEATRRAARGADWVAVSGSLPPGVPPAELAALLEELRGVGIRVAVDSSGRGLAALAQVADLVKVNRSEAGEYLGAEAAEAATLAAELRARVPRAAVVVTDGVRGAAASTDDGALVAPAAAATGRFPVGSGDAFLAGLLDARDRGRSWAEALERAREVAERNAGVAGPGILAPPAHGGS